jgi:hypothetical protein
MQQINEEEEKKGKDHAGTTGERSPPDQPAEAQRRRRLQLEALVE